VTNALKENRWCFVFFGGFCTLVQLTIGQVARLYVRHVRHGMKSICEQVDMLWCVFLLNTPIEMAVAAEESKARWAQLGPNSLSGRIHTPAYPERVKRVYTIFFLRNSGGGRDTPPFHCQHKGSYMS
jgi:hypothetical protein